ncbi:unnamed protein product [Paramecium pentaurelia]|uniref:Uncharacterized protein n=1 Tax=Paramecium pentaurelia TaxID=43138 RepID=A0A8S1XR73_9CILI|nr:unnamed protein product [Paramecium pentaurelia]
MRLYYKKIEMDCCFHQPVSSYYFIDDTQCHYVFFYLTKITMISEFYKVAIIFTGNIIISQVFLEQLSNFWKNHNLQINSFKFEQNGFQYSFSFNAFFNNAQLFRRNI